MLFANTARGHLCSVHTVRVYGPYRRAVFTNNVAKMIHVLDTRVHGQ